MLITMDSLLLDTDIIKKIRSYEIREILSFIYRTPDNDKDGEFRVSFEGSIETGMVYDQIRTALESGAEEVFIHTHTSSWDDKSYLDYIEAELALLGWDRELNINLDNANEA